MTHTLPVGDPRRKGYHKLRGPPKEQEVWASHWAPSPLIPCSVAASLEMGEAQSQQPAKVAAFFDSPQEKPSAMLASVPVLPPESTGHTQSHIGTFLHMDTTFRPRKVTVLSDFSRDKQKS